MRLPIVLFGMEDKFVGVVCCCESGFAQKGVFVNLVGFEGRSVLRRRIGLGRRSLGFKDSQSGSAGLSYRLRVR